MKAVTRLVTMLLLVGAVAAGSTSAAARATSGPRTHGSACCPLPVFGPGASYRPTIRPELFGPNVDNPWFPLRPGTTYVYTGTKDGDPAIDVFAVSRKTQLIDGVRTRLVNDRLYLNGVLHERTTD